MTGDKISRRGVYYDLEISPYEFKTPYRAFYSKVEG